mgnify:CR=1 FL=1
MILAALAALGAAPPPSLPPKTVLLLVADWCAPCRGELARLDQLAAAAQPYAVRVLLVDDTRGGRRMLAALPDTRRWSPEDAARTATLAALLTNTAGLPHSVAIGRDGRVCGEVSGGLWPAGANGLVARCRRSP